VAKLANGVNGLGKFLHKCHNACMKYSVQAAGRATGISPWRIRTWERRYGVPSPEREPNGRRTYSEADVEVLRRMAALTEAGLSAAHAAEAIRNDEPPRQAAAAVVELDHRAIAISESARRFDESACVRTIRDASGTLGWTATIEQVLMPAMRLVGELWERGEVSLAGEHFVSQLVKRELLTAIAGLAEPDAAQPLVLIACPEDEMHDLGAVALWLLLRERGVRVICLGADVPAEALVAAVEATRPDSVCLSGIAPTAAPMLAEAARRLIAARVSARVMVGGPALRHVSLDRVLAPRLPDELSLAVEALLAGHSPPKRQATQSDARTPGGER
jgi:MerR family transcriptional regulator, light-induced transcriptional regulator